MLPLILAGLTAAQGIGKIIGAGKQAKDLNEMVDKLGSYQIDEGVKGNVALTQNMFNGRMAGASALEQNILGSQAAATNAVERGATDSSQVLSLASTIQGNTNDSLVDLASKEEQSRESRAGQLQNAVMMLNAEKQKQWQDQLRVLAAKMGIKSTKNENIQTGIGDIANGLGMAGYNLFKK